MGLPHDGFVFLKGSFERLKGYAVGRMPKSCRGKLYIDDAGWGPSYLLSTALDFPEEERMMQ